MPFTHWSSPAPRRGAGQHCTWVSEKENETRSRPGLTRVTWLVSAVFWAPSDSFCWIPLRWGFMKNHGCFLTWTKKHPFFPVYLLFCLLKWTEDHESNVKWTFPFVGRLDHEHAESTAQEVQGLTCPYSTPSGACQGRIPEDHVYVTVPGMRVVSGHGTQTSRIVILSHLPTFITDIQVFSPLRSAYNWKGSWALIYQRVPYRITGVLGGICTWKTYTCLPH